MAIKKGAFRKSPKGFGAKGKLEALRFSLKHPKVAGAIGKASGILSKAGKFIKAHPVMIGASVAGGVAIDRFKKNRRKRVLGKSKLRKP